MANPDDARVRGQGLMTVPGELVVGFNYLWSRDHYGWNFGPRLWDPDGVIVTLATFLLEQQMAFRGQASARLG